MDQGTSEQAAAVVGHPGIIDVSAEEAAIGLISRVVEPAGNAAVIITETWDLTAERCPMIAVDLTTVTRDEGAQRYVREIYMRDREYNARFGPPNN